MRLPQLVLTVLLASAVASADGVDDFVRAEMARQHIPGLSLAVSRGGTILKAEGYGFADVENDVRATPETVYESGSVGKQFTATAVMMLVEGGRVGLDDPILKYFPEGPPAWKPITVRNLLTHTSGIHDYTESEVDYRKDYTEDQLVKVAAGMPLDFAPGTQWSYSNTGYVLLGILIHRVTGQFYGDFLHDRVFAPLGMTSTRVISEADIVPHRASGYRLDKGELKNQEWVSPSLNTTADGSLYLTVLDLARWDAALYGDRILKRESLREMWTPVRLANGARYPYGFAWDIEDQRGKPRIEHGGSWQGFRTHIARYLDNKLTVIVLTNLAEAEPQVVAYGVAGLVDASLALPDPRQPHPDPDPTRTAAMRQVLADWAHDRPSDRMGAGLRSDNPGTEGSKSARKRVEKQLGALESFRFLAEDDMTGKGLERRGEPVAGILYYGLASGGKTYAYRFHLNPAGQVLDFSYEEE